MSKISSQLHGTTPAAQAGRNPFVGPHALKTGEPIHGRDLERRDLRDLLIAERIVLLYSPSGEANRRWFRPD